MERKGGGKGGRGGCRGDGRGWGMGGFEGKEGRTHAAPPAALLKKEQMSWLKQFCVLRIKTLGVGFLGGEGLGF